MSAFQLLVQLIKVENVQLQDLQVIRSHQALLSCPPCPSQHSNQVHLLQQMGVVKGEQNHYPPSRAMGTPQRDLATDEPWAFNAITWCGFTMLLAPSTPSYSCQEHLCSHAWRFSPQFLQHCCSNLLNYSDGWEPN